MSDTFERAASALYGTSTPAQAPTPAPAPAGSVDLQEAAATLYGTESHVDPSTGLDRPLDRARSRFPQRAG